MQADDMWRSEMHMPDSLYYAFLIFIIHFSSENIISIIAPTHASITTVSAFYVWCVVCAVCSGKELTLV